MSNNNSEIVKRVEAIDGRLITLEDKFYKMDKQTSLDLMELSNLITKAVADGNKETLKVIDDMKKEFDNRISILENSEANKALEQKKETKKFIRDVIIAGIITTTIGWIVLSILNNYFAITKQAINENETLITTNSINI